MAEHQLPRELMESCLAASQEATFQGFDDSVLASEFADPKRRRLMETIYRMGFESSWRIREQQIAHGVPVGCYPTVGDQTPIPSPMDNEGEG